MTRLNLFLAAALSAGSLFVVGVSAFAQAEHGYGWTGTTDVEPTAYGLGVNADQYGRPHSYELQDGSRLDPIFNEGVNRDAYGLGVHSDEFGRPVYDDTWRQD